MTFASVRHAVAAARDRVVAWFGPAVTAIRGKISVAELGKVLLAAFASGTLVDFAQVLISHLPDLFIDKSTAGRVSALVALATGGYEFWRRLQQGADVKVVTDRANGLVTVTRPPDATTVVAAPGGGVDAVLPRLYPPTPRRRGLDIRQPDPGELTYDGSLGAL